MTACGGREGSNDRLFNVEKAKFEGFLFLGWDGQEDNISTNFAFMLQYVQNICCRLYCIYRNTAQVGFVFIMRSIMYPCSVII